MKRRTGAALALALFLAAVSGGQAEARKPRQSFPDLKISAISAPSSTSPGKTIAVSSSILNQGKATSVAFSMSYYLSTKTVKTSSSPLLGVQNVGSLAAGTNVAIVSPLTIPSATSTGTFFVVGLADSKAVVRESNEANNAASSGAITIKLESVAPAPTPVPPPSSASLTVWTTDALSRIQPTDPPGTGATAAIKAARNEYEAFQLVIRAPNDRSLSNVNVAASDLVGPGTIGKSHVGLYREHYIQVTTPSPGSPYPAGWWPDALIPFVNPETGQPVSGGRFPAAPFPVSAGKNQPIWVEVFVPEGSLPGTYTGQLTVTADGYKSASIAVTLTVWNFTLPRRPSMQTWFGGINGISRFHGVPEGSSQYAAIVGRYVASLIRHRVMPPGPDITLSVRDDGSIDSSGSHAVLAEYFNTLNPSTWQIPFWPGYPFEDALGTDRPRAIKYLRSLYQYLAANGWADRSFIYLSDEPGSLSDYQEIRDFAALIREAHSDLRILVTEQATPQNSSWGTLYGSVDVWVPHFELYDPQVAQERQARGEEVWTYAAGGWDPAWLIDQPTLNHRAPLWIDWRYGISGLLYWTTTNWEQVSDPWLDPNTYYGHNGEGAMLYPGSAVGYPGPVTSIRLKAIRDGMEDYEYLKLLTDLGDRSYAESVVKNIVNNAKSWNPNSQDLHTARELVGQRIGSLAR